MGKISLISLVTTPNLGWSVMGIVIAVIVLSAVFRKHLFHKENSYKSPEFIQAELLQNSKNFSSLWGTECVITYLEKDVSNDITGFMGYVYFRPKDARNAIWSRFDISNRGESLDEDEKLLFKSKKFAFDQNGKILLTDTNADNLFSTSLPVNCIDFKKGIKIDSKKLDMP